MAESRSSYYAVRLSSRFLCFLMNNGEASALSALSVECCAPWREEEIAHKPLQGDIADRFDIDTYLIVHTVSF